MDETLWALDPHTGAKHEIIRRYFNAWAPKLAWTGRLMVVDGFAGPGIYKGGQPGSPKVLLDAAATHTGRLDSCQLEFVFNEAEARRFASLESVIGGLVLPRHMAVRCTNQTFEDCLIGALDEINATGHKPPPLFVIADPFGPKGLPFALLSRVASQPRSEILVSLMYESINRFIATPEFEPHLDNLFGTSEWRSVIEQSDPKTRRAMLLQLYVDQLKKVAGFDFVSVFELRDSGNRVEYYLIHGTKNIEGLKAMKEAMWNVDPSGAFQFSDATEGRGNPLFTLEPDFTLLRRQIVGQFAGKLVSIGDVEYFVLTETAFRETHYKRQVMAALEKESAIRIQGRQGRRAGTFPDGTTVEFLP